MTKGVVSKQRYSPIKIVLELLAKGKPKSEQKTNRSRRF